jgi:hypothetical protein
VERVRGRCEGTGGWAGGVVWMGRFGDCEDDALGGVELASEGVEFAVGVFEDGGSRGRGFSGEEGELEGSGDRSGGDSRGRFRCRRF